MASIPVDFMMLNASTAGMKPRELRTVLVLPNISPVNGPAASRFGREIEIVSRIESRRTTSFTHCCCWPLGPGLADIPAPGLTS